MQVVFASMQILQIRIQYHYKEFEKKSTSGGNTLNNIIKQY